MVNSTFCDFCLCEGEIILMYYGIYSSVLLELSEVNRHLHQYLAAQWFLLALAELKKIGVLV